MGGWKGVRGGCQQSDGSCGPKPQEPTPSLLHDTTLALTRAQFHPWDLTVLEIQSQQPQGLVSSLGSAGGLVSFFDTPSSLCPSLPSIDGIYYGDNRFNTVSESGTATLKARPRVRPLLTFIPLVSIPGAQAVSLFRVGHLTCQKQSRPATSASPTVHSLPS